VLVVLASELPDAGAECLEGVEALDPEDLFFEGLDELLSAPIRFGLVVKRRAAGNSEVIDLDLVVL